MFRDSVDKIIQTYFACVTSQPFTYKKVDYLPRPLRVSEQIFRGFVCEKGCGGCCPKFSLDYLPRDDHPKGVSKRVITFNGRSVVVCSDTQPENDNHHCKHLEMDSGLCGIHGHHPFSCDFEVLRFHIMQDVLAPNKLTNQIFSRGWNMLRVDGKRGALCHMLPSSKVEISNVLRKLKRLEEWTQHFGIKTIIPDIKKWVKTGPHGSPLFLNQQFGRASKNIGLFVVR